MAAIHQPKGQRIGRAASALSKLTPQGLLLPCTNLFLWDILLCVAGISSPSHLSAYLPFCLHGFHFAVSVFFISFIQSSILFAMSAVTIMCLSSSGMVKVVSWSASSKINPVGFWMFHSFSVFLFLFSFSFDFAPSSLLALLPLTCARATRDSFPLSKAPGFLQVLGVGPDSSTFSFPAFLPLALLHWYLKRSIYEVTL